MTFQLPARNAPCASPIDQQGRRRCEQARRGGRAMNERKIGLSPTLVRRAEFRHEIKRANKGQLPSPRK